MDTIKGPWEAEYQLRNSLKDTLPLNEWCFISDADEIPDYSSFLPKIWKTNPDKTKVYHPELWDQYYNIDWTFTNKLTAGSLFFNSDRYRHKTAQQLRDTATSDSINIPDSGWHLSYFMTPWQIIEKLESFAHSELNTPYYKDEARIKKCIIEGQDLFERDGKQMKKTGLNSAYKAPEYFSRMRRPKNSLRSVGLKYDTDKATYHEYCDFYEAHLPMRPKSLLEIGVSTGSSIKMWAEYFPTANVEGWEIEPEWFKGKIPHRASLIKIDATDPEQVEHTLDNRRFDIIVDDGSHRHQDMVDTFNMLWPYTNDVYIIEDIHTVNDNRYQDNPSDQKPLDPVTRQPTEALKFDRKDTEVFFLANREKDSWTLLLKKK